MNDGCHESDLTFIVYFSVPQSLAIFTSLKKYRCYTSVVLPSVLILILIYNAFFLFHCHFPGFRM